MSSTDPFESLRAAARRAVHAEEHAHEAFAAALRDPSAPAELVEQLDAAHRRAARALRAAVLAYRAATKARVSARAA